MNNVSLPELRVGEPTRCGSLAVVPLYHERTLFPDNIVDYLLSDEAQEVCTVREVSKEGKVGEVLVENTGERPVLLLEGEILCGAKQDRVVRSSVLVTAGSQVVVPVYCVERGRWSGSSASLKTGSCSPPSLRHLLKGGSHRPSFSRQEDGQGAVWRFIRAAGASSPKENLSDVLRSRPEVAQQLRQDLQYPAGACGIAVVMRGRIVGIDLFDQPSTLAKLWDRLVVLGLTLDAADLRHTDRQMDDISEAVKLYMEKVRDMRWRQVEPVGLGETYRATGGDGSLATALVADGTPIHLSVSVPTNR